MESVYSQFAWLIPLFPLIAYVIILAAGRQIRNAAGGISALFTLASFVVAVLIFLERLDRTVQNYTWNDFIWLTAGPLQLTMGFEINNLNALMLLIVTLVSLLVNIYSLGYMAADDRKHVFFGYVSLFTFSMLGLVISANLLQLYIFWELVGLCSFLLIGFWYFKPEAKRAAKKAFIVTRIGDVGLLIGILVLFWHMPNYSLDFSAIANAANTGALSEGVLTAAAILIFLGAIGKSGQFPLHTWLPDAMEGPTPISALIHAATMVAAGVYLVARTYPVFTGSGFALDVVAYVGAFTAIFAAFIALAQNDFKRVLAYSTISQLGYMMMAMGIGSALAYSAGMFHLFTHAFFKALLFLAAGSVIHALNKNDIMEMGGVGRKMKTTMWTFAFGALALAGIVPFSGFWSKDAILAEALAHDPVLFVIGIAAAFLTALYMGRLFFLVFAGKPRSEYEAHESPFVMTGPLVILAVLALVAGAVMLPTSPWLAEWLTGRSFEPHLDLLVIVLSTVAGVAGLLIGWLLYGRGGVSAHAARLEAGAVYRVLANKFYIDELYHYAIVVPVRGLGRALNVFDDYVVDGLVRFASGFSLWVGRVGARLQNGQMQTYSLLTLIGMIILFALFAGRRFF